MEREDLTKFMDKVRISHPNFSNEEYVATRVMAPLGGKGKRGLYIYDVAKQEGILTGDEVSRWDRSRPLLNHMLKTYRDVEKPEVVVANTNSKNLTHCLGYMEREIPYFYPVLYRPTDAVIYSPSVFFRMSDGEVRVFTNVDCNMTAYIQEALPASFWPMPKSCNAPRLITMCQTCEGFMKWLGAEKFIRDMFVEAQY
jgi:hypothetical protein